MKTSAYGRLFITNEEGKKNLAYPDPLSPLYQWCQRNGFDPYNIVTVMDAMRGLSGEPWTIGVGHTGSDVHQGTWWSDDKIAATLEADLARWETALDECVTVPLTQNQYDALISFSHNLGEYALPHGGYAGGPSTLLRKLNAGDYQGAADQFPEWCMARGVRNEALYQRRLREKALFLTVDPKENV